MMTSQSGHRESSVPRNKIVTVSSLDIPRLKDRAFGVSVDIDNGNMHMSDLIVVLVRFRPDFGSTNKDVGNSASFVASFNAVNQVCQVFVSLDVETAVPLSIFGGVADVGAWSIRHEAFGPVSKKESECPIRDHGKERVYVKVHSVNVIPIGLET